MCLTIFKQLATNHCCYECFCKYANTHKKKYSTSRVISSMQSKVIRHFCVSLRKEEFCSSNGAEFLQAGWVIRALISAGSEDKHYSSKINENCLLVYMNSWEHSAFLKESLYIATFCAVFMVNILEIEATINAQTSSYISVL